MDHRSTSSAQSRDFRAHLEQQDRERERLYRQAMMKNEYDARKDPNNSTRWREYTDMPRELKDKRPEPSKAPAPPFTAGSGASTIHPTPKYHRSNSNGMPSLYTSSSTASSSLPSPISSSCTSPAPQFIPTRPSNASRTSRATPPSAYPIPNPPLDVHHRSRSFTNPTNPLFSIPQRTTASDSDLPTRSRPLPEEERRRRDTEEMRRKAQATAYLQQRLHEEAVRRAAQAERDASVPQPGKERIKTRQRSSTAASEHHREQEARQMAEERRNREYALAKQMELQRIATAWNSYESRWKSLNEKKDVLGSDLTFADIPWPLASPPSSFSSLESQSIREFLLSPAHSQDKGSKQRLRDAMLRFHPDRFEGRWMNHIRASDRTSVKEGVGRVVRFLNEASTQLS